MKRLMLLTAAFSVSASMAVAAITPDDLVAAFQAKGYSNIEVTTGLGRFKVEAVIGSSRVEVTYDATSGAILTQETKRTRHQASNLDGSEGSGGFDDDHDDDDSSENHHGGKGHGADDSDAHEDRDHGDDDHDHSGHGKDGDDD